MRPDPDPAVERFVAAVERAADAIERAADALDVIAEPARELKREAARSDLSESRC